MSFNNKKLQEIAGKSEEHLAGFGLTLDQISADIKEFEALLRKHGVCLEIWIDVNSQFFHQKIGWAESAGKWRLCYRSQTHPEPRPLLETPVSVRLDTQNHLPDLLAKIASEVSRPARASELREQQKKRLEEERARVAALYRVDPNHEPLIVPTKRSKTADQAE